MIVALFTIHVVFQSTTHKNNSKPKVTTKSITNFTIVEVVDCNWCTIKMMSVTVSCESFVALITISYFSSEFVVL